MYLRLAVLLCLCLSCGCSVGMALSGKPDPNLSVVKTGASRGEIELQLGHPVTVIQEEGGCTRCLYEFEVGKNPSAGRAIAHGIMDALTLGIWEVAGTPIEGLKGSKRRVQILYGPDNKIKDVAISAADTPPVSTPSQDEQATDQSQP